MRTLSTVRSNDQPRIDFARLARERFEKAQAQMVKAGVDAMLLTKPATVQYVLGARSLRADASREQHLSPVAVVPTGKAPPHLFTADADGVSPLVPQENVHPLVQMETEAGVTAVVRLLRELFGGRRDLRLGVDTWSMTMYRRLPLEFPAATFEDADAILQPARMIKTPDEIECLKLANALNEAAMYAVVKTIRPGIREVDLTATFVKRVSELGIGVCHVDSVFCALPKRAADAPWQFDHALPYRWVTRSRTLEEGDMITIDTGIFYTGYLSDFGRTWYCTAGGRPTDRQRDLYKAWREVYQAAIEQIRPGARPEDVLRAALKAAPPNADYSPSLFPRGLYLSHGIGFSGIDPPYVGTDLGLEAENRWTFQPGMVQIVEPYIWQEGVGGFRSEEIFVITEKGPEVFGSFPYGPLGE